MNPLDIQYTVAEIGGTPVSLIELLGMLTGLVSVYLASRMNILTWPTGIVNEVCLFVLFYQIQLYADMLLQVFFLIVTILAWRQWRIPQNEAPLAANGTRANILLAVLVFFATAAFGQCFGTVHEWLPTYFSQKADYPYADSFVMVSSMAATVLMAQKRLECWLLWITVDLVCTILFFSKGVYLLAFEYVVFLLMALYGFFNWYSMLNHGKRICFR